MKYAAELTPSIARKLINFSAYDEIELPERVYDIAQLDTIKLASEFEPFRKTLQNLVDHKMRGIVVLLPIETAKFVAALKSIEDVSVFSSIRLSGVDSRVLPNTNNEIEIDHKKTNVLVYGDSINIMHLRHITTSPKAILITPDSRAQNAFGQLYGHSNLLSKSAKYWTFGASNIDRHKKILASFSVNY